MSKELHKQLWQPSCRIHGKSAQEKDCGTCTCSEFWRLFLMHILVLFEEGNYDNDHEKSQIMPLGIKTRFSSLTIPQSSCRVHWRGWGGGNFHPSKWQYSMTSKMWEHGTETRKVSPVPENEKKTSKSGCTAVSATLQLHHASEANENVFESLLQVISNQHWI